MMKFLRTSVSALVLSAFAVAPVLLLMTADYAYAKNGNGNGNGNGGGQGNGNGGNGNGGGKSADKGNGGDKASKGQNGKGKAAGASRNAAKASGRTVKDDFKALSRSLKANGLGGLFAGPQKQSVTPKSARAYSAPTTSDRPPSRIAGFKADALHPSNLGKLNGAINSSPRAKQAHIENGQYLTGTGPVSLAAGLAVADFAFAEVLGPDNTLSPDEVQAISAAYDVRDSTALTRAEAEAILADPGAYDPDDVAEAQAVRDAYDLTTDPFGMDLARPSEEALSAARAVQGAEVNLLSQYKGGFSEDETVAAAQQYDVLGAVRASNPDPDTVRLSLGGAERQVDEREAVPYDDSLMFGDDLLDEDWHATPASGTASRTSDETLDEETADKG